MKYRKSIVLISRSWPWASMKRGGCTFGDGKTRGCPLLKKGGCSFTVGTQIQIVNVPPPPGLLPRMVGADGTSFVRLPLFVVIGPAMDPWTDGHTEPAPWHLHVIRLTCNSLTAVSDYSVISATIIACL